MDRFLEICCTSFQSVVNAQNSGADRIELCDNIYEGGTTPSNGLISKVKSELVIPVHVLIRPRGGNFIYSEEEFDVMRQDIVVCKENGVNGVVSGVLREDYAIDLEKTAELVSLAKPMNFTFHRAFDLVANQQEELFQLIELGVSRVLTSGGRNSVYDGRQAILDLVRMANQRIQIMAGGGLKLDDISGLMAGGCQHFHTTAKKIIKSSSDDPEVLMNSALIEENTYLEAASDLILAYRRKIDQVV